MGMSHQQSRIRIAVTSFVFTLAAFGAAAPFATASDEPTRAHDMESPADPEPRFDEEQREIKCLDNSDLYHACDNDFTAECDRLDGEFVCVDWFGDDCKEGSCIVG